MTAAGAPADDCLLPFSAEALDVRGRIARLGPAIDALLKRHAYPEPVSRLVGEAVVITALLGSALKSEGRFQLQTKTDGAVSMIVVDFDAPDRLRAMAQFSAERLKEAGPLLGRGHLAFTIEPGGAASRYQGIVALDSQGLEAAARQYFRQSEQIPTEIKAGVTRERGAWRAGGLLLQFLPKAPERLRRADLDPGDAPEGAPSHSVREDDSWAEAKALAATVQAAELTDASLSAEDLLYRLFHERGVSVYPAQALREACRCSRGRILATLKSFGEAERIEMIDAEGRVSVTCEFCSTPYVFSAGDVAAAH